MKTQRLRDPVHGLITFRGNEPLDQLAWRLIDTPEFQRLRRIKQLGVSEFVYPGATHTRFSHSIGVFEVARRLTEIIRREIKEIDDEFDEKRAKVAMIAALLHDIGHGPFSHTFERVQRRRGADRHHEQWSAAIIRNPKGSIFRELEAHDPGLAGDVADLLVLENPKDIYHAIVSSSFDADRLDYLRRDRQMTGTGDGAIDFDWLLEHVRVRRIDLEAPDGIGDPDSVKVPTFCIALKALPAAEQFLMARYTLHQQVYFHKATRSMETMIAEVLRLVSEAAVDGGDARSVTGLEEDHPLIVFFRAAVPSVEEYIRLDDMVVFGALERMERAGSERIAKLAVRLRRRNLYKALDSRDFASDSAWQRSGAKKVEHWIKENGIDAFHDPDVSVTIYNEVGGKEESAHKKLRILAADGKRAHEITDMSSYLSRVGTEPGRETHNRTLTRFYFAESGDRDAARKLGERKL
ncbi:HD domain-containing protein [Pinisolibacter sp.]|uniref:HD domain-containing protein n=1 Tax=Pinisolibacter sp. TaxID=2172024 RepID=UPI002FDE0F7B